jgi:pyridoxamine 5'-phosphate oxidase
MSAEQPDLARLRRDYAERAIEVTELTSEPSGQFGRWFAETDVVARKSDAPWFEPNAMVLTTCDPAAGPSSRTVLLKGYGPEGFTFYTNLRSRKGRQIAADNRVSLLFPWYVLERQVIVRGTAAPVPDAESDAYFASRPRGAQLGAWASEQSEPIPDRAWLEGRLAEFSARYPDRVPRPAHWGGLRVSAESVEFWQGRPDRLHDRLLYARDPQAPSGWRITRLSP